MATRHALSDLSLLNLCPATPPGALFLLLTPSARLLTTLWRRRFMSSDKGKQKQPQPFLSLIYSSPHFLVRQNLHLLGLATPSSCSWFGCSLDYRIHGGYTLCFVLAGP